MPQGKKEQILFGLMMAPLMVYGMIVYNIAIEFGGLSNEVFVIALHELIIMAPIAFILEGTFVSKLSFKLAFKVAHPEDRDIFKIFAIQTSIVMIMCPIMSLIATLLFADVTASTLVATWIQKYVINLPFALFWQIVICGPLVRTLLQAIRNTSKQTNDEVVA